MSPESPPIRLNLCVASKREPGTIYFTTRPGGAGVRAQYGWLIGIGGDGQIVLNKKFQGTSQDLRCLPSGNILFSQSAQGLLYEVGADGATHRIWHSRDKWAGLTPPAGSVELPINQLHHTVNVLPDGNFLILDAEQRDYEGWPTSTTDRDAPRQKSSIVGDVIKEVTQAGQLVREHRLLDILDPYRITHGSMETYWHKLGFPGAHDWSHANAIAYDAADDCLVISVRHQDCIVKLGRKNGRIRWILGNPSEWSAPWTQHLLQPEGDLRWQFHQHDCSAPAPNRVLCFDNGNFRAGAYQPPLQPAQNFSRAVEFEVDEAGRKVRQVWVFGEFTTPRVFACYQGGARRLPRTGNTILTFGGICLRDGTPAGSNVGSWGYARILEVTPDKEVVLDIEINDEASESPMAYSAFRSDHSALAQ
jgi:hypothetical protein